eukprot:5621536-Heterocapsa_arctica.AAC.1
MRSGSAWASSSSSVGFSPKSTRLTSAGSEASASLTARLALSSTAPRRQVSAACSGSSST